MTPSLNRLRAPMLLTAFVAATVSLTVGTVPRSAGALVVSPAAVADTQRVTIKVAGMFCESCEASVRAMLKRTPGVYSATVDVKRGEAIVAYDPKQTTPQALADVINRLGYKATLPPAAPTHTGG